jgi:hypothetical protein
MNLYTGNTAQRSPDSKHTILNVLNFYRNLKVFLIDTMNAQPLAAMTDTCVFIWLYK